MRTATSQRDHAMAVGERSPNESLLTMSSPVQMAMQGKGKSVANGGMMDEIRSKKRSLQEARCREQGPYPGGKTIRPSEEGLGHGMAAT